MSCVTEARFSVTYLTLEIAIGCSAGSIVSRDLRDEELTNGRAALVFSLQTYLAETPEQSRKSGTPGYLSVGMAGA